MKRTPVMMAMLGFAVLLGGFFITWQGSLAPANRTPPEDLTRSCGIITCNEEFVGVGVVVKSEGMTNHTYFVTAWHNLEAIKKRTGKADFSITIWFKNAHGDGAVPLHMSCSEKTVIALKRVDLAAILIDAQIVQTASADIRPVHFSPFYTEPSGQKPGLALYRARLARAIGMGYPVLTLTAQSCHIKSLASEIFPVLMRQGTIALVQEDPGNYAGTDGTPNFMFLDCPAFKGNSGSPVFVNIETRTLWGRRQMTSHLLGIVTSELKAKGDRQHILLYPVRAGNMHAEPQEVIFDFQENAGLTHMAPVDYLARILSDGI